MKPSRSFAEEADDIGRQVERARAGKRAALADYLDADERRFALPFTKITSPYYPEYTDAYLVTASVLFELADARDARDRTGAWPRAHPVPPACADVVSAANAVIAAWEGGNLAEAVNEMRWALDEQGWYTGDGDDP